MSQSQDVYARSIRLGRLVPREVIQIKYIERAPEPIEVKVAPPPPPEPEPEPTNVIVAPIPVASPYIIYREYPLAQDIINVVSAFYGVRKLDIRSERRTADIVKPRQICMYLMRELTPLSHPQIGRALGGRDHTTALHGYRKYAVLITVDDRIRDEIDLLKIKISELMAARNAGRTA